MVHVVGHIHREVVDRVSRRPCGKVKGSGNLLDEQHARKVASGPFLVNGVCVLNAVHVGLLAVRIGRLVGKQRQCLGGAISIVREMVVPANLVHHIVRTVDENSDRWEGRDLMFLAQIRGGHAVDFGHPETGERAKGCVNNGRRGTEGGRHSETARGTDCDIHRKQRTTRTQTYLTRPSASGYFWCTTCVTASHVGASCWHQ